VEGSLVSQIEEGLTLSGSKFLALPSFNLVLEEILLPLGLLEGRTIEKALASDLNPAGFLRMRSISIQEATAPRLL